MNFKLNIIQLLTLGCLAAPVTFTSCSEDAMDEVNMNPNNPIDVNAKFLLADVITSTAFYNVGGDFSTYLSTYVEHEVGTDNQLWRAEHRVNEPKAASTFDNGWGNLYSTIRHAKIIIEKCSVGGSEEGNFTTLGIAQVLAAYNLALLTDMFGDVPYSEAMDINLTLTPKIDSQEDIYKEVHALLDAALVNLPKGDRQSPTSYDLLYNGSASKWVKFANGLKARYTMRLLNVSENKEADLAKVIEYADKSFASASDEAAFNVYNAQNLNPLFDFQWSRDGLAASKSLADKLIEKNDPRADRNFVTAGWVQVDGLADNAEMYGLLAPNGENQQVQYKYLTSAFVFSQTASTQLLSYHEVLFLKAEAMQRLGKSSSDIEKVLTNAVKAAIVNSEKSVEAAFIAPTVLGYNNALGTQGIAESTDDISEEMVNAYIENTVLPSFKSNGLKEIVLQKYFAFFGASGESTEMYSDIRRWKALGENFIELKNPNVFPLRLPYGNSETTTNPAVQAAYGDGDYVYTENVWWAGGVR